MLSGAPAYVPRDRDLTMMARDLQVTDEISYATPAGFRNKNRDLPGRLRLFERASGAQSCSETLASPTTTCTDSLVRARQVCPWSVCSMYQGKATSRGLAAGLVKTFVFA